MSRAQTDTGDRSVSRDALPLTIIRPSKGWVPLRLRELWQYHELLYLLTWRDIKVRYKQTAFGLAWVVLQPLTTMVIFSLIFGRLAKLPSDGIPYPVFSFAALLPWNLFAGSLTRASTSLVSSSNLLTKVYFPRLIIPISAVLAGLVDFAISLVVLLGMMLYYGIAPGWGMLALPALLVLAVLTALAVGLWFAAMYVQYRDVGYVLPFLVQAWMYASPVAYSANLIPAGKWQLFYAINPMVGIIQGFRWALLGSRPPSALLAVSALIVLLLLVTGLFYFRRLERTFADVV